MTGMRPQRHTVESYVYPKSMDVLAEARILHVVNYIRRRRYHIAKTTKGQALLEEYMGGGEVEREFKSPHVVTAGDGPERGG